MVENSYFPMASSKFTSRDERAKTSNLDMRPDVAHTVITLSLVRSLIYLAEEFHGLILHLLILSHKFISPQIRSSTNFFIADSPCDSTDKILSLIGSEIISSVIILTRWVGFFGFENITLGKNFVQLFNGPLLSFYGG